MRKTLQVSIALIILAAIGGGAWLLWPKESSTKTVKEEAPSGAQVVESANTVEQVDQRRQKVKTTVLM